MKYICVMYDMDSTGIFSGCVKIRGLLEQTNKIKSVEH